MNSKKPLSRRAERRKKEFEILAKLSPKQRKERVEGKVFTRYCICLFGICLPGAFMMAFGVSDGNGTLLLVGIAQIVAV